MCSCQCPLLNLLLHRNEKSIIHILACTIERVNDIPLEGNCGPQVEVLLVNMAAWCQVDLITVGSKGRSHLSTPIVDGGGDVAAKGNVAVYTAGIGTTPIASDVPYVITIGRVPS